MYFYEGHVPHIIKLELLHILGSIILFITKTLKKNFPIKLCQFNDYNIQHESEMLRCGS